MADSGALPPGPRAAGGSVAAVISSRAEARYSGGRSQVKPRLSASAIASVPSNTRRRRRFVCCAVDGRKFGRMPSGLGYTAQLSSLSTWGGAFPGRLPQDGPDAARHVVAERKGRVPKRPRGGEIQAWASAQNVQSRPQIMSRIGSLARLPCALPSVMALAKVSALVPEEMDATEHIVAKSLLARRKTASSPSSGYVGSKSSHPPIGSEGYIIPAGADRSEFPWYSAFAEACMRLTSRSTHRKPHKMFLSGEFTVAPSLDQNRIANIMNKISKTNLA